MAVNVRAAALHVHNEYVDKARRADQSVSEATHSSWQPAG